jgi:hypothetical protein
MYHCFSIQKLYIFSPHIAQSVVLYGSHTHYLSVQHQMVGFHQEDGVFRDVES